VGARFERVDLTDIAATQATIARLAGEGGAFDVLVNNAANDDRHRLEEVTPAYWDERLNVNLKHHFFCAQAVVAGMRAKGGGAIVNLGSISWHLGLPELPLYQTAKAAIEGLTRSLARDLGPDNIRVTCVVPGNVRTPRQLKWYTPEGEREIVDAQCLKGRLAPEDVAAMVLFLASDDARLVTGHEYFVDAGWR
jgi:NAD(P)-dependent dehydrogenase (short-subunit alcohol dehydrogenase family)